MIALLLMSRPTASRAASRPRPSSRDIRCPESAHLDTGSHFAPQRSCAPTMQRIKANETRRCAVNHPTGSSELSRRNALVSATSLSAEHQPFGHDWPFVEGWTLIRRGQLMVEAVTLPHDVTTGGGWSAGVNTVNRGACPPVGRHWYAKTFRLPADADENELSLRFERLSGDTVVRVNGREAARCKERDCEVLVPLTPFVTRGVHVIVVVDVDGTCTPEGRTRPGPAIHRPVWLRRIPKVRLGGNGTQIDAGHAPQRSVIVGDARRC